MLRIRLRRTGARKKPQYRFVIAESTSPRDGHFIEIIGTYNPLTDPSTVVVKEDRAKHWLSVGATPSERVHKLLAREGIMEPFKYKEKPAQADESGADTPATGTSGSDAAPAAAATAPAAEDEAPAAETSDADAATASADADDAESADAGTADADTVDAEEAK